MSAALLSIPSQAQEAPNKPKNPPPVIADDDLDPPRDPDSELARLVHLSKNDPIFRAVRDSQPLAESPEKPGEFKAFLTVVRHAITVPPAAMERHARDGIQYADLVGELREQFLADSRPFRVAGRLVSLKLIDPDQLLKQKTGLKKLYDGWMYAGNDCNKPVRVFFWELPPGLHAGDSLNDRVAFDGYYFKLSAFPAKDDEGKTISQSAPLLIGRSIKVVAPESASAGTLDEAALVRLARNDVIYKSVVDERPVANPLENYHEYTAYGLVFRHAHKFAPEVLNRHARRDVVYADLIGDTRQEFLRELLHVEGRLVRLRKRDASERLRETSHIKVIYEGWIYHENEYRHPICVAFTELPPEIKPGETLSYRVAFDGYYFKKMGYPSQEKKPDGKPVWHAAPLLIGRKLELTETESSLWSLSNNVLPLVLIVVGLVSVAGLGLMIWVRRSDRRLRAQMQDALTKENPFVEAPPPVRPGDDWNRLNEPSAN